MKKKLRIILSIVLPIICIASVCLSFFLPRIKADTESQKTITETTAEDTGASSATKDQKGGAIYIENGANYTMRGGTIMGKTVKYGGAVYIANGSTFTMEAGTITGCQAKYGGAIYVEAGGTCNINGGSITGNKAEYAPAIYVENGGTLNINNESVIENNEYAKYIVISRGTIVVGNPSANFNLRYIDFGNYPQWYVGSEMNTTLEEWYTANTPTAVNTYLVRTRTWQAYQYTDGNIYARGNRYVYDATYTYLNGETLGASSTTEYTWFKVEPIRWIVLNYDAYINGRAENIEVMSYLVLTADICFNASSTDADGTDGTEDDPNQWVNSELRSWLNSTFYTSAFASDEQALIKTTSVGNNKTGDYNTSTSNSSGTATQDKIYVPSYWDLCDENVGSLFNSNAKRLCSPTDFALSNKAYRAINNDLPYRKTGYYWTRSAGSFADRVFRVSDDGGCIGSHMDVNYRGVRAVLQLSI